MEWKNKTINLGSIKLGSINRITFELEPGELDKFTILDISTGCSCTVSNREGEKISLTYTARKDIPPHLKSQGYINMVRNVTVKYKDKVGSSGEIYTDIITFIGIIK